MHSGHAGLLQNFTPFKMPGRVSYLAVVIESNVVNQGFGCLMKKRADIYDPSENDGGQGGHPVARSRNRALAATN